MLNQAIKKVLRKRSFYKIMPRVKPAKNGNDKLIGYCLQAH
jgi:hypothetical protein